MKSKLLIALIALGVLSATQYASVGSDGITGSPKYRATLDAQKAAAQPSAPVVTATVRPAVFGSPRFVESSGRAASTIPVATKAYSLQASCTGSTIVASPKMRETRNQSAGGCCSASSCVVACSR